LSKIRLDKIQLSWFRGAAQNGILELNSKNAVVYGTNASGKSSFVDAIEYIIRNGKVSHLSHEYSGRRQELGIRNTHAPDEAMSQCAICFDDGSQVSAEIAPNGTFIITSEPPNLKTRVQKWVLENHILRQDEVARFIISTKGEKYSVLLPLLGLDNLEYTADNLKSLGASVKEQSKVETVKIFVRQLANKANVYFTRPTYEDAIRRLSGISKKYIETPPIGNVPQISKQLGEVIDQRIDSLKPEYDRYLILSQVSDAELDAKLEDMISARENVIGKVDALLDCRIAVLESTLEFTHALDLDKEIPCPSCGQIVRGRDLADHVTRELESLIEVRKLRDAEEEARRSLATALNQAVERTRVPIIAEWLQLSEQKEVTDTLEKLDLLRLTKPDAYWTEEQLEGLREAIPKLVDLVKREIEKAPPSIKELIEDRELVQIGSTVPGILALQNYIKRIEVLTSALETGERLVRDEIKSRTESIIEEISVEVQRLWSKLHPNEPIEEVRLYIPGLADRAIDIALKFFGVDQPSPRLTLSESHRNCLGLCIFLSLALLRADREHPIVLDDIVSSLDREHRGRIADVLVEDLADRQVLLFTHDREWYNELRYILPSSEWKFMVLRPWENPSIGLQWSESIYTFDDTRTLLPDHPKECGNSVRAVMDGQLAIIAEKLRITLPYLRGDQNDRRTCVEFLNRIIGEAPRRLLKKQGDRWLPYPDPISDWNTARDHLIARGDRASHTGTLTVGEAEKLIEICERALNHFRCPSCGDYVWIANQSSREWLQCTCGELQWRYG
jgi:hypothetical protein